MKFEVNKEESTNHYDKYPFEYIGNVKEKDIKSRQFPPFVNFLDKYTKNSSKIAEIGCGPGRCTLYMTSLNLNVYAVDLSRNSLEIAKKRAPKANFIFGDNTNLPFDSESFDIVISDGVIHHTTSPEKSLRENARILKYGGKMYLSIYKKYGKYYFLFITFGSIIRMIEKKKFGKFLLNITFIPFYYLVHKIRPGSNNISYKGAKNLFYDYFISPIVFFKTKKEILNWASYMDLKLIDYIKKLKNSHVFYFVKK